MVLLLIARLLIQIVETVARKVFVENPVLMVLVVMMVYQVKMDQKDKKAAVVLVVVMVYLENQDLKGILVRLD